MAAQGAPAMMRLRMRPSTGGPTIKLQVPLLCTLQGLKDLLSPQAAVPANSLAVSLNKEDEIHGPGGALLSSLGITSGDLLFYSVVSHRHPSPPVRAPPPHPFARSDEAEQAVAQGASGRNRDGGVAAPAAIRRPGVAGAERGGRASGANAVSSRRVAELDGEAPGGSIPMEDLPQSARIDHPPSSSDVEGMVIGGDGVEPFGFGGAGYREDEELSSRSHGRLPVSEWPPPLDVLKNGSFQSPSSQISDTGGGMHVVTQFDDESRLSSRHTAGRNSTRESDSAMAVPDVFRRVLACEFGNVRKQSDHLILAVHAIMLDTGFTIRVGTKEHSGNGQDESAVSGGSPPLLGGSEGYGLHLGWSDAAGSMNFAYVLSSSARRKGRETSSLSPNSLLAMTKDAEEEVAFLRCQVVGDFVIIYGIVSGGITLRLCLSVTEYLHKRTSTEKIRDSEDESFRNGENVLYNISELWREVKDNLSLPLLTSLCEKIGIPPPPSLVRLPTELKAKVLDCLHPVDLARLSCVCSDFRVLSSNDELWKQKYKELFGSADASKVPVRSGWRTAFMKEFERRKNDGRRGAERLFRNEGSFGAGRVRYRRNPTIAPHFGAGIDRYFHRTDGDGTRDSSAFGTTFGTSFPSLGGGDHVGLPSFGCGYNFGRRRPRNLGSGTMFSNHFLRPYGDGVCLPLHEMSNNNSSVMQPLSWIPPPSRTTDVTMPMASGPRMHQTDTINTRTLDDIYGGMSSLNTTGAGMGYGGLPPGGGLGSFYGRGVAIGNIEYSGRHAVPGAALPQDGRLLASSPSSFGA